MPTCYIGVETYGKPSATQGSIANSNAIHPVCALQTDAPQINRYLKMISRIDQSCQQLMIPGYLNFLAPTIVENLIRLGKDHDGGYVITASSAKKTEYLISMGIAEDWSFEANFITFNPRLKIHGYDHTISKKVFFKNIVYEIIMLIARKSSLKIIRNKLHVYFSYLAFFSENAIHFPERINHRQEADYDVTIDKVFSRVDSDKVFVKIDIEGSEYLIIDDLLQFRSKIIGMALEFHNIGPLRLLFNESIKKLTEHYEIIHLHANNIGEICTDGFPETMEITLIRKEFCCGTVKRNILPVQGIDAPNDPSKPDYKLIFNLQDPD